jgi:hypothetical protein
METIWNTTTDTTSPQTMLAAQHEFYLNIAAISAALHAHRLYDQFLRVIGPSISGSSGVFRISICMAAALSDWEAGQGGTAIYDTLEVSWIDLITEYVDEMLRQCITEKKALNARTVLDALPVFIDDETGAA